jgi:hypothetical protein
MIPISQRGGAQVGWLSASWPLAGIKIELGSLVLSALGGYIFKPSDVHAIEPVGSIPVLTTGIRIHHNKVDYPEEVIFYSVGGRERLLHAAREAGFAVGAPTMLTARGFPVRTSAIVAVVLMWNLLFFLDRPNLEYFGAGGFGLYSMLALVMAFLIATATPVSSILQTLILREGHNVGEIRGALRLLQIVSGILAVSAGLSMWSR